MPNTLLQPAIRSELPSSRLRLPRIARPVKLLGCFTRLLHGDFAANLAKRLSERTIDVRRAVAGDEGTRADDPNPRERQGYARRHL